MTLHRLTFTFLLLCMPFAAHAEEIRLFESEIELSRDGSFTVIETIEYDFGEEYRHGIFRDIPLEHPQESDRPFHTRYITVELLSVTQDGEPVPYEESVSGNTRNVRIGDPDRTITGPHTYELTYHVDGALMYYSGAAELYWNVTGNDWDVPILRAVARVPNMDGLYVGTGACYQGAVGETAACEIIPSAASVTYAAADLAAGEGLTVARAVDPELVDRAVYERMSLMVLWLIGAGVWFIGLFIFMLRYITRHRTGRAIIAQYEPYAGFKPMYTGLLFDGRIDPHDITAGIVYLAEQGFFKIKRTERKKFLIFDVDDYEITVRRPYNELGSELQRKLFTLLFDKDAAVDTTVTLSKLVEDTAKQRENHKIITGLKKAAEEDLLAHGFFEYRIARIFKAIGVIAIGLIVLIGLTAALGAEIVSAVVISIAVLAGSAVLLAFTYRRRTRKGYEALDYLKGFKEFLSVTDRDRFVFHNAPAKSPEQFMAYLPYAIAFGVEKEWAKVFDDITIPQPDWYNGQGATFSAISLTNSLDAFSTTLASASGAAPASSGGGSTGGGVGGGGGGSW